MGDNDTDIPAVKVVLLGESGVGKTSIINSFTKKTFSSQLNSTPGASFVSKTFILSDKDEIKFEIWDTAGQERFRSITRLFYKNASVIIMVYDITQRQSFEELKKYWYGAIKTNAGSKIVLAVVGNKSDMYALEDVPEQEAKDYAKSIKAVFWLTSAKCAEGIDDLFKCLGMKCLDPNYKDTSCLSREERLKTTKTLNSNIVKSNEKPECKC